MTAETVWLGRLDSNQGMAESKSGELACNINAHSENRAKNAPSNNNSLAADSEWLADIPTEPKAFERWLVEQGWGAWPLPLKRLAIQVGMNLTTVDQTAWHQSYALRKAAKADWKAFTTALAAYRAEVRS